MSAIESGAMHRLMSRCGRLTTRHPWPVIAAWLLLTAVVAALVLVGGRPIDEDATLPGSAGQHGRDLLETHFPASDDAVGQVIFKTSGAALDDAAVADTAARLSTTAHVSEVGTLVLSPDRTTGYLDVTLDVSPLELTREMTVEVMDAAVTPGLEVLPGGALTRAQGGTGHSELIGIVVALAVLVIAFGGLVAAALPLVTAAIVLVIGVGGIGLAGHLTGIPSVATTLATMIGLGVGIDYALFLITRYRALLDRGRDTRDAITETVASSGSAIVFAGATVVVALAGLGVAGVPILATLGWTSGLVVVVAVAAATTLLPALLTVLGPRIAALPVRRSRPGRASFWGRLADRVIRRPWRYVLASSLLLLVLAAPLTAMTLGQTDAGDRPASSAERAGYDAMATAFGPGANGPLTVVAELSPAASPGTPAGSVLPGATPPGNAPAGATPPGNAPAGSVPSDATAPGSTSDGATPPGATASGNPASSGADTGASAADATPAPGPTGGGPVGDPRLAALAEAVAAVPGVVKTGPVRLSEDGLVASMRVTPDTAPSDPATLDTADRLDALDLDGVDVYVTGQTAVRGELATRVADRMPLVIVIVVLLSGILVLVAFRAPVVAAKAAVMNLLSVAAAYGALTAVFQWGWGVALIGLDGPVPIEAYVPMMLFALLFGLSMDYEVFLLTAVRESWDRTRDNRLSVRDGLAETGVVITSAALIMVCVFASFVLSPEPVIKMMGLGLAVAIAVDATVIRGLLVPALMTVLGDANWWTPRRPRATSEPVSTPTPDDTSEPGDTSEPDGTSEPGGTESRPHAHVR
ncbi:MMPL family transporter [Catenuloplanes japonicus]|uniref:MMPL family transporter n=1 Tax=Catenuloplanes japonicus TaxID=33876 RepID=UPI000690872F|nr:MMPL family transporter [Catenuloplanes japonicus]